ncbi:MAG: hypothetical protein ACP5OV_06820 [Acidimicrobiales bacterium]
MSRRVQLLGSLVVAGTASLALFLGGVAGAAGAGSVALSAGRPSQGAGTELTAIVDSGAGTPVANAVVTFSVHVEEFAGAPLLTVGTATTDAAGVANITYQPTWAGPTHFVASAALGATTVAEGTLTAAVTRTDPFAGPVNATRTDGLIGRWTVAVLLALVVAMWIVLLALVVRVQQGPTRPAES